MKRQFNITAEERDIEAMKALANERGLTYGELIVRCVLGDDASSVQRERDLTRELDDVRRRLDALEAKA